MSDIVLDHIIKLTFSLFHESLLMSDIVLEHIFKLTFSTDFLAEAVSVSKNYHEKLTQNFVSGFTLQTTSIMNK